VRVLSQVKNYARVADSIIGWGSSIGRWGRIENKSVVGEDVHVRVSARPENENVKFSC
jgi:NDP-sugar pyrophosphorylase family protein